MSGSLKQFVNCKILRNHKLMFEDLWVRNGKIINPEKIFFEEQIKSDVKIDCKGSIIAPGFIELQINGAFGIDFSMNVDKIEDGVLKVAKGLLPQGVTSFCPTLVTSPTEIYKTILPEIRKRPGGKHGATILGVHVEGPFINPEKKGAHPVPHMKTFKEGFSALLDVYGSLDNIVLITLAPELENAYTVIEELKRIGILVSVGHSMAGLTEGETAFRAGAGFITHLFNAMLPFHHRDPGLVGLLSSIKIPENQIVYYGIIADGIHTHPAALRIAYRTHPTGLVLVTDAISAMGLGAGKYTIGQFEIEVRDNKAFVSGTDTLCGSIATMDECVRLFLKETGCTAEYALEVASLHPAMALGIADHKGTLNFGSDADLVMLDDNIRVVSTWIAGECVFEQEKLEC